MNEAKGLPSTKVVSTFTGRPRYEDTLATFEHVTALNGLTVAGSYAQSHTRRNQHSILAPLLEFEFCHNKLLIYNCL